MNRITELLDLEDSDVFITTQCRWIKIIHLHKFYINLIVLAQTLLTAPLNLGNPVSLQSMQRFQFLQVNAFLTFTHFFFLMQI